MNRFTLIQSRAEDRRKAFAQDVRAGLTQQPKELSCCYFYDAEGSRLFEAICDLPEYYPTRCEREILDRHAAAIVQPLPDDLTLAELGSGNADKTRLLIAALLKKQGRLRYVPIDICSAVLRDSAQQLVRDFADLEVTAVAAEYRDGLRHLQGIAGPKLILWLGSNVGNFHRAEAADFLRQVRSFMTAGDRFLMGVDLRKDRTILEPAYDDAQGVTAEFNFNLLIRINRELAGHFDLARFQHRAVYRDDLGRIEMHLVSRETQRIRIDALDLDVDFAAGETIHTENSYKYSLAEIEELATQGGFALAGQWFDARSWFSVSLLQPR
jgi:dimethylhistidine N-methyltransferase